MPLHLPSFASKVRRFREMVGESLNDLSSATGIAVDRLALLEAATHEPTGDEVLILADHYRQDFQFFISNQDTAVIDRTEKLFRAYADDLSPEDRRNIQEFLYLAEGEAFLVTEVERPPPVAFEPIQRGDFFKQHAWDTAPALRAALGYGAREVPDVFRDVRALGVRVFRRRLSNRSISGLFINHPFAGRSILVNYEEDVYRQRFTAAHELAHALFDVRDDFVVSFWDKHTLKEVRADNFANAYLVPDEIVNAIPSGLDLERLVGLASQLRVNPEVLGIALQRNNRLSREQSEAIKRVRIPKAQKIDPELPDTLSPKGRARRLAALESGISSYYADLAFEAYDKGCISRGRLAELLLVDDVELRDLAATFGKELS